MAGYCDLGEAGAGRPGLRPHRAHPPTQGPLTLELTARLLRSLPLR